MDGCEHVPVAEGIVQREMDAYCGDFAPRFVRVNALRDVSSAGHDKPFDHTTILSLLTGPSETQSESDQAPLCCAVSWVKTSDVFSLPPDMGIASSRGVLDGVVAGIDAASVAAVDSLDPHPGDAVLDLCAAPGAKFALIAERMGRSGELVGVDVSEPRIGTLCTLLRRYLVFTAGSIQRGWRCRVYAHDATKWADATRAASAISCQETPSSVTSAASPETITSPAPKLVLDSLRENLFRKPWAQGCRGIPPPVEPRDAVLESIVKKLSSDLDKDSDAGSEAAGSGSTHATIIERILGLSSSEAARGDAGVDGKTPDGDDTSRERAIKRPRLGHDESKSLSADASALKALLASPPPMLYDRVLVDAQCTHDGSLRHVAKAAAKAAASASAASAGANDVMPSDDAPSGDVAFASGSPHEPTGTALQALQRGLLASGFACLRPGGTLVYSTCSMEEAQDEEVVRWLLNTQPAARLVPLPVPPVDARADDGEARSSAGAAATRRSVPASLAHRRGWEARQWQLWHASSSSPPWISGTLPGTAVFHPACSGTSGMFLARITKE